MIGEKIKVDTLLDARGLFCPMPVVRAKEEIDKMEPGQILQVIADDPAAEEDVPRWAKRLRHTLLDKWREGDDFYFIIRKEKTKNILDAKGLSSQNLIERAREEIDQIEPLKLLQVITDNIEAEEEIPKWAKEEGHSLIYKSKEGDELLFIVRKEKV